MSYLNVLMLAESGVAASMDTSKSIGERLALGGEVTLLGLGVVFFILFLLWGILELFRVIFYKPAKKAPEPADDPVPESVPVYEPEEDSDELIAAISAAVAAYMADESAQSGANVPATGFRVVSFRKVGR